VARRYIRGMNGLRECMYHKTLELESSKSVLSSAAINEAIVFVRYWVCDFLSGMVLNRPQLNLPTYLPYAAVIF
jgi:hypothetical protein